MPRANQCRGCTVDRSTATRPRRSQHNLPFFYRSFGFVQFDNPASAQAAIRGAQGTMIGGLSIDVTLADNR